MNHIVIIGFMGSGKTRVGKRLAKDLGLPFIDVDRLIVKKMNMSVKEVFERFGEAFLFRELPKDEMGVGAYRDGVLLGMAGATNDSDSMWQIGINVMPEAEGLGIGSMLVAVLKNEILKRGKLPFYGTSMSHIASQRVALGAGFVPMWAELYCESCK